jgi:hypothetical protein
MENKGEIWHIIDSKTSFKDTLTKILKDGQITPEEAQSLIKEYEADIRYIQSQVTELKKALPQIRVDKHYAIAEAELSQKKQQVVKSTKKEVGNIIPNIPKILKWFDVKYTLNLAQRTASETGIKDPNIIATLLTVESQWWKFITSYDGSSFWPFQLNANHFKSFKNNNWKRFKSKKEFIAYLRWNIDNNIRAFKQYLAIKKREWKNLLKAFNSANFDEIARIYNPNGKWYADKLKEYYTAYDQLANIT